MCARPACGRGLECACLGGRERARQPGRPVVRLTAEASASGRLHTRAVVLNDLRRLRAAGIDNLNIDLIAGPAGQTLRVVEESPGSPRRFTGVPHASIYMLEVDEDSRLGREVLTHGLRYHYQELVPCRRCDCPDVLPGNRGAGQSRPCAVRDLSNFCRPGMESQHNLRYWRRRPYLGLGLDASSMLNDGLGRDAPRAALGHHRR